MEVRRLTTAVPTIAPRECAIADPKREFMLAAKRLTLLLAVEFLSHGDRPMNSAGCDCTGYR